MGQRIRGISAFVGACLLSCAAFSQPVGTARITGDFAATFKDGEQLKGTFTCTGTPTCIGTLNVLDKLPECPNAIAVTDARMSFTGVDLSRPGTFQGEVTLSAAFASLRLDELDD